MQAQTETLPRMRFTGTAGPVQQEREELARQAHHVLGYQKMARTIVVPDALAFTLRALDIQPLVLSSVLAYKAKKERTGVWSARMRGAAWLSIVPLALTAIGSWLWYVNHTDHAMDSFLIGFGGIMGSIVTGIFGVIMPMGCGIEAITTKRGRGSRKVRRWERIAVNVYTGNVPEFALNKAIQIKTALPKAIISIDSLTTQREEDSQKSSTVLQLMRDPFLVAELGTEVYYIDVWDEKEYERTL